MNTDNEFYVFSYHCPETGAIKQTWGQTPPAGYEVLSQRPMTATEKTAEGVCDD